MRKNSGISLVILKFLCLSLCLQSGQVLSQFIVRRESSLPVEVQKEVTEEAPAEVTQQRLTEVNRVKCRIQRPAVQNLTATQKVRLSNVLV